MRERDCVCEGSKKEKTNEGADSSVVQSDAESEKDDWTEGETFTERKRVTRVIKMPTIVSSVREPNCLIYGYKWNLNMPILNVFR